MHFKSLTLILALCLLLCTSGCRKPQEENNFVQVVNPLVTVDSVLEMEERLGYAVPVLDKEVASYIVLVIDGAAESGRIRYADGSDFNIKRGTGDISGIYGGELTGEETIGGTTVSFFAFEDIRYAIWEQGGFTYSLTGGDTLPSDITALIS